MEQLKKYPRAVVLKRSLVGVFGLLMAIIMTIVVTNIRKSAYLDKSSHEAGSNAKITSITKSANWYKDQEIKKLSFTPIKPTLSNSIVKPQQNSNSNINPSSAPADESSEQLKKAMNAPITSNQVNINSGADDSNQNTKNNESKTTFPYPSNTDQNSKKVFLKENSTADDDYLHQNLKDPISPYELKAGSIIPAILITGINSDLPGQITAQVRSNVYDTIAGRYVLIPQGSKLTGLYDSQIVYGQSRVLIVWRRIIYPNGKSINLEGMPGIDMSGYAGFHDQVNNHYLKLFGSVILMSAMSAGAQLSQPKQQVDAFGNPVTNTVNQTLAASLGANIMNTADHITQKNLNVQPTLVIRPGYLFNVNITKDIVFPKSYGDESE
jgi:type IV secretion system protein VirB10